MVSAERRPCGGPVLTYIAVRRALIESRRVVATAHGVARGGGHRNHFAGDFFPRLISRRSVRGGGCGGGGGVN